MIALLTIVWKAGVEYVIVNGLCPRSNKEVLDICQRHKELFLPAAGIYPLDVSELKSLTTILIPTFSQAACNIIASKGPGYWTYDFDPPEPFDVDSEVAAIEALAARKEIVAIGECGLDKHYFSDDDVMAEQERVLRLLLRVAKKHDLPVILHTRKAEERVLELLIEEEILRADFHCFCGKAKLGRRIAEAGYYLSIPSAIERSSSFQKLVSLLPMDKILTETDSPYMGPDKDVFPNDPSTIPRGVRAIAKVKNISNADAAAAIRRNFSELFRI